MPTKLNPVKQQEYCKVTYTVCLTSPVQMVDRAAHSLLISVSRFSDPSRFPFLLLCEFSSSEFCFSGPPSVPSPVFLVSTWLFSSSHHLYPPPPSFPCFRSLYLSFIDTGFGRNMQRPSCLEPWGLPKTRKRCNSTQQVHQVLQASCNPPNQKPYTIYAL